MKNLAAVCFATLASLCLGSAVLGGAEPITVEKTCITAQQLRTRDGGELYQSLCSTCHGNTGIGDGPAAPALAPQPTNLTLLAEENGGRYPSLAVLSSISGEHVSAYLQSDMPRWEDVLRHSTGERAEARHLMYLLNKHVRTLQAPR